MKTSVPALPKSPFAVIGLTLAVLAFVLVLFGTFSSYSALRVYPDSLPKKNFTAIVGFCFAVPVFLGLVGGFLGGKAMVHIEESRGKFSGDGFAVFAMLVGLLAAVTGVINSFAFWFQP